MVTDLSNSARKDRHLWKVHWAADIAAKTNEPATTVQDDGTGISPKMQAPAALVDIKSASLDVSATALSDGRGLPPSVGAASLWSLM